MKNLLIVIFSFSLAVGYSQEKEHYSFSFEQDSLIKVLDKLEDTFDVKFSYLDSSISDKAFSLKSGKYNLSQILKLIAETTAINFQKIDARYYAITSKKEDSIPIDNFLKEVIVQGYLTKGITKQKDNHFKIIPKRMGILPGLTEPDILQTLQQLPGVISPNETATGINVRGGTPDQNLLLWDGIKMYHNGHLFGMISGFNPNIVQSVNFYNKGTNARYGGRVSSVIDIKTSDKIAQKKIMELGVNLLNADLNISLPVIENKLSIQVAGRRSFTDLYQSYTYDMFYDKVFQNTKISDLNSSDNIFYFQDYEAKINYRLSKKDFLSVSAILIDNDLDNQYLSQDESVRYRDLMTIYNEGYGAHWQHQWTSDFLQKFTAYYSKYRLDYDYNKQYNPVEFDLFSKKNKILDSGFSIDNVVTLNSKQILDFGYQLTSYDVSHAFISKDPSLSFILDAKSAFIQTHSIYGTYDFEINKYLNLQAGLRYNYYSKLNEAVFEPRFMMNFNLSKGFKVSLSGEIKNQIISQIKETVVSDLSLENQLWILSDGANFPIIKAEQLTAGAIYKKNHWTLDLDTYYKYTSGLTTLTLGFLNNLDPSFHLGESISKGIDFYVKKDLMHLQTWLTYSFNSTENKFENINEDAYFPYNSEIRHAVNLSLAYKLNKFQVAMGWYWRTGKPYTLATVLNNSIQYDEINGERLSDYHRLDFSSIYNFDLSKNSKVKGKLGLSIYNVYNQKNLVNREYSVNQSIGNEIEIRDKYSLQFTPNMFFRMSF